MTFAREREKLALERSTRSTCCLYHFSDGKGLEYKDEKPVIGVAAALAGLCG